MNKKSLGTYFIELIIVIVGVTPVSHAFILFGQTGVPASPDSVPGSCTTEDAGMNPAMLYSHTS